MNTGVIFRSVHRAISSIVPKILTIGTGQNILTRHIHYICDRQKLNVPNCFTNLNTSFLQPVLSMYNPVCGMKVKGRLQLRCKGCYYVWRRERLYVMCKIHPRHKQTQLKKKEYKTWKITWASQSKIRGW